MLFIILVLVLSFPSVQSSLGEYVTDRINNDFGTNINVKYVRLKFNGDIQLRNVYIEDYKQDTLINVNTLNTSIRSIRNITNGNLVFGDVELDELTFNLKTHKGDSVPNLDVFINKFQKDNPNEEIQTVLFSSSDVSINDGIFRVIDENKETPKILEFKQIHLNATNLVINGPNVTARVNTMQFLDSRGLRLQNLVTNFAITPVSMSFGNLVAKTAETRLKGDLEFNYVQEEFRDFVNKVNITANFKDSYIGFNDLNNFYDEFGDNQTARIDVDISGTLNDLQLKNLKLNSANNTRIYGDIKFKNLLDPAENSFAMDGDFYNMSSNYYELRSFMPNVLGRSLPSVFAKVGNFKISGQSYITKSTILADLDIVTNLGHIRSNMDMKRVNDIDNACYVGNVVFDEFNLGKLIENEQVGVASFNVDVDGKGFTIDNVKTKVEGKVFNLMYNGYNYKDITIAGTLGNQIFNGSLISNDENFKLQFKGLADLSKEINTLDFTADVYYADLRALNFASKNNRSVFKGRVETSLKGSNIENAFGTLNFRNTTYANDNSDYFFQDFTITSSFNENVRTITINSPDIITGGVTGDFRIANLGKLITNSLGSLYTNYVPNFLEEQEYLDFDFKIYNKIIEVFYPELVIGANTSLKGHIETDEKGFKLNFITPQIKWREDFANDVSLKIDNGNPLYNTYIELDSLHTGVYNLSEFSLINVTKRDTLFIETQFKGGKTNADTYDLSMFYTIDPENKSVVGFKKSKFNFKENDWFINENKNAQNKVVFDRQFNEFVIYDLVVNHEEEEIALSGALRDSTYKQLNVDFTEVQLAKITPSIDSLSMRGKVNGRLNLQQEGGIYLPSSDVEISNLEVNDIQLGNLKAKVSGNRSLTNYSVDVILQNDNIKSLVAKGNVDVSKDNSKLDLDVSFEEFLLDPLAPLGEGVITNIRGFVSGTARVTGDLSQPSIDGELLLDNAGLTIDYLNVDYAFDFDSRVELNNQQFIFKDVDMTDSEFFSTATLNGFISHNNFQDWKLGLDIETDRLLVLNTKYTEESLFYGTAFMEGTAELVGPTDQLTINVDATTAQGTVFKIPLNDFETYGDNSFIHFLSPEEKQARLRGEEIVETDIKGLELNFDLIVEPNADIEIVIDRNSGSTIQGNGYGNLLFEINTNGKFKMFGDFSVEEGIYNFAYGGLIERKIEVEPGGSLLWSGNPLDAQINLKAIYRTQANPSVLLDNPINRSIPVVLEINLTGQLEQPEPDFNFLFPNLSSTVKSELDYRLDTRERRENQALFLLASGTFASEIGLGQQAYGTISDRLNSLVNSFITDDNGKIQVGLNYQIGENTTDYRTDDRVGLTLSTDISERVRLNGKVGVPVGGVTQTVIAGDVQVDILLNEEGTLIAKFFNRENNIRNFGEKLGYTQGIGISYNVEFDTFKELFMTILSGKDKDAEILQIEADEASTVEEENLPSFIKMKPKNRKKIQ
ncbi:Family of unknown function [Flavobacteriaceae bacterium MAR_2010_188]|nr:Family of unknown function [Flavobacteriaceae bacterium MAR_2010_188]